MPDEPFLDVITGSILNAYRNAARARRYLVGASVHPLRLSAREISDWLDVHPLPMPRSFVDDVMFALDEVALTAESEE